MKFVASLAEWEPGGDPSAVTIGMFDGVHLGHQSLVNTLRDGALDRGLRSVAITFDRHPRAALAGQRGEDSITVLEEKLDLLAGLGVDGCGIIPVESGILGLPAPEFVEEYLVRRLGARLIVVGYDFRFGKDRTGSFELLQEMSARSGYTVVRAEPVLVDGRPVKSTWVRDCIRAGDMPGAARLLGRPYSVAGGVTRGSQLGRQLGYPTANVAYPPEKLLPALGIYAGSAVVDGRRWTAAINLGIRPTLDSANAVPQPVLEAYLLDFSGDLYGQTIKLEFHERLREEKRFPNLESLKEQITRDVEQVRRRARDQQHRGPVEGREPYRSSVRSGEPRGVSLERRGEHTEEHGGRVVTA